MDEDNFAKELELDTLIGSFYAKKSKLDYYKKETDSENTRIKELMSELNLTEFENDSGLVAKMSVQNRESFNEDALISRLKELGVTKPIKTVEVIDYEVLEDAIYNNEFDATKITDCKQSKKVITLKVSEKKGK